MKRRTAIKQFLIIAGGIAILPACSNDAKKASIALQYLNIDADQEMLLAELVEAIIPKGDSKGAKDLNLHLFVLKMIDDCHPEEEQKKFMEGLKEMDVLSQKRYNTIFVSTAPEEKQELLHAIQSEDQDTAKVAEFYRLTKRRTIQGFMNSKYVMTDLKKYELVPGRYNGYFPVTKDLS